MGSYVNVMTIHGGQLSSVYLSSRPGIEGQVPWVKFIDLREQEFLFFMSMVGLLRVDFL